MNPQKSEPAPEHRQFYDERRESEESHGDQGGNLSPVQLAESDQAGGGEEVESLPGQNVSSDAGGAKMDSYFKKRDYD